MSADCGVLSTMSRSRRGRIGVCLLAFLCGTAAVYATALHLARHSADAVEQGAEQQTDGAKPEDDRAYLEARTAADQARQHHRKARQALDGFLAEHFRATEPDARHAPAPRPAHNRSPSVGRPIAAQGPVEPAATVQTPTVVDNPQWLVLAGQRSELQRKRGLLLVERTPLHPDVRDVDQQIALLDRRLAEVPRQISTVEPRQDAPPRAGPPDETPPIAEKSAQQAGIPALPSQDRTTGVAPGIAISAVPDPAETARRFRTLRDAVIQAEKDDDRAHDREGQAWQQWSEAVAAKGKSGGQADGVSIPREQIGMVVVALVGGLIVATGLGLFSAGFTSRNRPFSTAAQVERSLSVPIVGAISGSRTAAVGEPRLSWVLLCALVRLCVFILLAGGIGMLVLMMNREGLLVPN